MNKNEYRRSLIMLRPRETGYAGHVRLERRVLMGSMDFIVTAPQGEARLEAALAGQRGGEYYAAGLGQLRRDRRGQAALAWSFDPRNIDGRPLDAYSLALVARVRGDGCAVVLAGNVDGARPVDMDKVEAAVCALFRAEEAPAADLPEADAPDAPAPTSPAEMPEAGGVGEAAADASVPELWLDGTRVWLGSKAGREGGKDAAKEMADEAEDAPAPAIDAEPPAREEAGQAGEQSAAGALGLDPSLPWPGVPDALRARFADSQPVPTLEDDFIYIEAPLGEGGPEVCRVGLHAVNGTVDAVRYAVPALYTPEPPEGLETWGWAGDNTHGYWVTTAELPGEA